MVDIKGKFKHLIRGIFLLMSITFLGCLGKNKIEPVSVYLINKEDKTLEKIDINELKNSKIKIDKGKIKQSPPETIALKLPAQEFNSWKELARSVTQKDALVEYVPVGQNGENWQEIITIMYKDRLGLGIGLNDAYTVTSTVRKYLLETYPENKITWNMIESSKNENLYEWILHEPYKNSRIQHNMTKQILTKLGSHCIIITKKDAPMTALERENWIKVLKESTQVLPFEKAGRTSLAISLADRSQSFLDLESIFSDWKFFYNIDIGGGSIGTCYIPSDQIGNDLKESLEVCTTGALQNTSINKKFEVEKMATKNQFDSPVIFDLLEESSDQMIYTYSVITDGVILTAVVRSFIAEQGFCFLCYKKTAAEKMNKEDILLWKEKLKMIKQK